MYKLVVADDEARIREGIVNLFPWRQIGFEITGSFANGQQVLSFVINNPVNVVLSDIKMPILDGINLAEELAAYPHIRVVFLTAYQDFYLIKKALQAGVMDYLIKPIKYEELLTCFEKVKKRLDQDNNIQPENHNSSYYDNVTATVKSYIDNNIKSANLEQAAVMVYLSPSHLSRVFKENAGQTFTEYLIKVRMEKAVELMGGINMKLYEIADKVGYDNPKNFSRAFKQFYNMTPREYREQGTAKNNEKTIFCEKITN